MTRCSVCALPEEKQNAIAEALAANVPLSVLSDQTGLSKSSLWRHSKHIAPAAGSDPPPTTAIVAKNENRRPQAPAQSAAMVPPAHVQPAPPLVDRETALAEALDRAELLFREALDGLEAAKEPIRLSKPDGSTLELPGDLRSRAAFIRAGRDVLDQLARLRGLYDPQATPRFGDVVFENVIMMPKLPGVGRPAGKVVDVQPEPTGSIGDGGTPDRGNHEEPAV